MSAQLIFSDLDGTLINDDLKVTAATRDAIRRQIINGNIFVPASARLPKGMMTVVNQILKVCPFIAYNGALALDETGKVLISRFFNAKEAAEICRYVDEQDNDAAWNIYSGYVWYCSEEKSPRVKNEERIVEGVHKGLIMGDSADLDRMQEELTAKYPDLTFVRSAENLLEIVLKGVSKASAVKIVAQEYGVDLQNCIAFGDNYNDEDMLEEVGYPFLMGNAPAELKQKFAPAQITADNNHDGVAKALAKIE